MATTISPLNDSWPQFLTSSGDAVVGRVSFYNADISSPSAQFKTVYSDASLSVVAPNPIKLDATGKTETQVFLGAGLYFVVVESFMGESATMDDYWNDGSHWTVFKEFWAQGNGSGFITADMGASTLSDLKAMTGMGDGYVAVLLGYWNRGDCSPRIVYFDADSSLAEDGISVFAPNSGAAGRWLWKATPVIESEWCGVCPECTYAVNSAQMTLLAAFCQSANRVHTVSFGSGTYYVGAPNAAQWNADFGDSQIWMKADTYIGYPAATGFSYTIRVHSVDANGGHFYTQDVQTVGPVVKIESGILRVSWFPATMSHWAQSTPGELIVDKNVNNESEYTISKCKVTIDGGFFIHYANKLHFRNCEWNIGYDYLTATTSSPVVTGFTFDTCRPIRLSQICNGTINMAFLANSADTEISIDEPAYFYANYDATSADAISCPVIENGTVTMLYGAMLTTKQTSFPRASLTGTVKYGNNPATTDGSYYTDASGAVSSAKQMGASAIDFRGESRTGCPDAGAITLKNGTISSTATVSAISLDSCSYTLTYSQTTGSTSPVPVYAKSSAVTIKSDGTQTGFYGSLVLSGSSFTTDMQFNIYGTASAAAMFSLTDSNYTATAKSFINSAPQYVSAIEASGSVITLATATTGEYGMMSVQNSAIRVIMKGTNLYGSLACVYADVSAGTIYGDLTYGQGIVNGNRILGDVTLSCGQGASVSFGADVFTNSIGGALVNNIIGGQARTKDSWITANDIESDIKGRIIISGKNVTSYSGRVTQGPGNKSYAVLGLTVTGNTCYGYDQFATYMNAVPCAKFIPDTCWVGPHDCTLNGSIVSRGMFNYTPLSSGVLRPEIAMNASQPTIDSSGNMTLTPYGGTTGSGTCLQASHQYDYAGNFTGSSAPSTNVMVIKNNMGPIGCAATEGWLYAARTTDTMLGRMYPFNFISQGIFRLSGEEVCSSFSVTAATSTSVTFAQRFENMLNSNLTKSVDRSGSVTDTYQRAYFCIYSQNSWMADYADAVIDKDAGTATFSA